MNEKSQPGESLRATWNRDYDAGRWDFLRSDREQARLDTVARMVGRGRQVQVTDLGCGEALLLDRLDRHDLAEYVAVDISDVVLDRIRIGERPVTKVRASLAEYDPPAPPPGAPARVVVASEVLYFGDDAVAHLVRIVRRLAPVERVIVSSLAGRADKPNWERSSRRVLAQLQETGWSVVDRIQVRDAETDVTWNLICYSP